VCASHLMCCRWEGSCARYMIPSLLPVHHSYMLPFQACVEKGKVTSLMVGEAPFASVTPFALFLRTVTPMWPLQCSYNAVNGVPSCANSWLLDTVARKEWGFDGYITSDCDADNDVIASHHYLNHSAVQGVADVLHAGTDVDCGGFVGKNAQAALDAKTISEADMDVRLVNLFKVRIRLTHFDPLGPLQDIGQDQICSEENIATSMDGVVQSAALIKNTGKALPLSGATAGNIAVIGPNAQLSQSDAGYYGPHNVCSGSFWTVVDAMKKYGKNVTFDLGSESRALAHHS
jgi:xylan 1,4-beta-xylosidase